MTHVKFMNNGHFADAFNPKNFSRFVDNFLTETLPDYDSEISFRPRVDIVEREKSYDLHVILPGLEKEHVSVETEGNKLVVSGERQKQNLNENEKYQVSESFFGKFKRSFNLPKNANTEAIKASFKNGILEISIEKSEPSKSGKVIDIL